MFAFLVSACLADDGFSCGLVNSSMNTYGNSGSIAINCTGLLENQTISAKFGSNSSNITDYTFKNFANTSEFSFNYTEENLTQVETMITFAVLNESNVINCSVVNVTLLPTPVIVSVSQYNSSEQIYPNTNITFSVVLNNTRINNSTTPMIKFAVYDSSMEHENFTNLTVYNGELTAINETELNYSFTYRFGEPFTASSYNLTAQFTDELNQSSNFIMTTDAITVTNATINCTKLEQENFEVASSMVKINCTITGSDSMTFRASPGLEYNESKSFPCTYDSGVVTCNFTGNTEETDNVTFALLSDMNATYANQTLDLKLIPKPVVALDLANSSITKFPVGDNVTFIVNVTCPTLTEITGQAELVAPGTMQFTNPMNVTLTKMDGINCYNFTYQIPNITEAGTYCILFQATNLVNISSEIVNKPINVTVPSIKCNLIGENRDFQVNGTVNISCIIEGTHETKINATVANNYSFDCMNTSDMFDNGKMNYTCNFTDNTMETDKVLFALISSEDQILANQTLMINLIPQPEIDGLEIKETGKIYFEKEYQFMFNLTKPTITNIENMSYVQLVNSTEGNEITNETTVHIIKTTNNQYSFNFTIPSEETEGERKLLLKVQNKLGENTTIASNNFSISIKPTLTCTSTNPDVYFPASGLLNISCTPSSNLIAKTFKYSFDNTNWMNATFDSGNVTINYTNNQTSPITEIQIGVFENESIDTEIINTTVKATIFPMPKVSKVEDAAAKDSSKQKKYIAGASITYNVEFESFYMSEKATVKYAFVDMEQASPSTWNDTSLNNGTLTVMVPNGYTTQTTKCLIFAFTDLANQTVNSTVNVSINKKVKFAKETKKDDIENTDSKGNTGSTEMAENVTYQANETITYSFELYELDDNWKEIYIFGYRIGSPTAVLNPVTDFINETLPADSTNRRILSTNQRVSFNVTLPEYAKDGETKIYLYTLDKDNNIVSDPVVETVTVNNQESGGPTPAPEQSGLTGGQIAAIVVSVIVVILVIVIIIIAILCMKKEDNVQESEDQISDSGSGVMV